MAKTKNTRASLYARRWRNAAARVNFLTLKIESGKEILKGYKQVLVNQKDLVEEYTEKVENLAYSIHIWKGQRRDAANQCKKNKLEYRWNS